MVVTLKFLISSEKSLQVQLDYSVIINHIQMHENKFVYMFCDHLKRAEGSDEVKPHRSSESSQVQLGSFLSTWTGLFWRFWSGRSLIGCRVNLLHHSGHSPFHSSHICGVEWKHEIQFLCGLSNPAVFSCSNYTSVLISCIKWSHNKVSVQSCTAWILDVTAILNLHWCFL